MDRHHSRTKNSSAFTLIELLVAVGIIVLLIAIAVPVLMHARQTARRSETSALLTSLMTDVEAYYQSFNAYPGPAPAAQTTLAGAKLSGTQNLLLGLTYALNAPAVSPAVTVPGTAAGANGATGNADPTKPTGPADFGSPTPTGGAHGYSPFFQPGTKELSAYDPALASSTPVNPLWDPAGVKGAAGTGFAFPTILDRFPDALPILYYRRTPGVDGTATVDTSNNIAAAQGTPPIVAANTTAAVASFYLDENKEYTTASALVASSGVVFDETRGSLGSATQGLQDLANIACTKTPGPTPPAGTAIARGGYVLISAGVDRVYGRPNTGTAGAPIWGPSDDIVVVGGQ